MELPDIKNIKADVDAIENDLTKEKNISVSILRLDKIHPEISGNKLFKLYYFLQNAIASSHKTIITFGGAFSNHLTATAAACKLYNLKCIGIVRGEKLAIFSPTLQFCMEQGMQLEFISREKYKNKNEDIFKTELQQKFGDHILIPEGGFSEEGVRGAALIQKLFKENFYTHICCPVGTATTFAGLIKFSENDQQIIGFSALKNFHDLDKRLKQLEIFNKNYTLINDYHFGGFAKSTDELISFMNEFYHQFKIPTDFVYTAKMMFGVFDLIKKDFFPAHSKILCIHTGGLQGNASLTSLNF